MIFLVGEELNLSIFVCRYIFNSEGGQDKGGKSEKISMTSPVKAEMLDGGYKARSKHNYTFFAPNILMKSCSRV